MNSEDKALLRAVTILIVVLAVYGVLAYSAYQKQIQGQKAIIDINSNIIDISVRELDRHKDIPIQFNRGNGTIFSIVATDSNESTWMDAECYHVERNGSYLTRLNISGMEMALPSYAYVEECMNETRIIIPR